MVVRLRLGQITMSRTKIVSWDRAVRRLTEAKSRQERE
jgi:hypothetical protein